MLRLSQEQLDTLETLMLRRHAEGISRVLAATWPALTERLQERWPAFVEAAVQQGRKHGLVDAADLARYAGLWCVWGPSFDAKPGFAWAAEILADRRRGAALKLHQLAHRTREELRLRSSAAGAESAGAAPAFTADQFDAALAKVERGIAVLAAARSIFPRSAPAPVIKACDCSSIDMMVAEADNLQEYRRAANGWHRAPVPRLAAPPAKWMRAPEQPVELAVTSNPLRGGPPARLNLRIETNAVCDPRVHPEVVQVGPEGRLAWKGRDAARLSLALYAPSPPVPAPTAPPGIAAEPAPELQTIQIASCGLRDTGAPFGDAALQLRVYDADQWLMEVRHPAWQPMVWPAPADAAPAAPGVHCTLERDGVASDAGALPRAWSDLHTAFRQGLERLHTEWSKALDGSTTARLEVEASPLVGEAGLTWGWRRTAASTVRMRVEGALDLLALSIDLRLSGDLVEGPARSRVRLQCKGRSELRMAISQIGDEAAPGQELKAAQRSWRFPFTLEIDPLAGAEPATLSGAAVPAVVSGALAGECGLRPRPDGAGQQWFFALRVEPVSIVTETSDPGLGAARQTKAIFPALTLVSWSAG